MSKSIDIKAILSNNKEPKFSGELSQTQLTQALNWYAQNRDNKDASKYASDFLKKKHKITAGDSLKTVPSTFGFLCRIVSTGGVLSGSNAIFFDETISKLSKSTPVDKPATANIVSIQDHIKRKSSDCIGELEGQIDELITSEFKSNVSPYATMTSMDIKGAHTKFIIDHFKTRRTEYDDVLTTADADVKEAYSNFTKVQLKKLVAYCDQVILDGMKLAGEAVKSRKPRKRKAKSAEQIVAKMNLCLEHKEMNLNLKSIDPKTIIGASQLWVYNVKTRKLGVYQAADAAGLNIKGSTIQNFAESKSVSKTLRKPAVTLPEVLKAGKVALRNVLSDIRAAEKVLTGRINADTILLRTVK
jgi:hypothetical protein